MRPATHTQSKLIPKPALAATASTLAQDSIGTVAQLYLGADTLANMLNKTFNKLDQDNSQDLDRGEFKALYEVLKPGIATDKNGTLRVSEDAEFQRMDHNADGKVSKTELLSTGILMPAQLTDDSLTAMIEYLKKLDTFQPSPPPRICRRRTRSLMLARPDGAETFIVLFNGRRHAFLKAGAAGMSARSILRHISRRACEERRLRSEIGVADVARLKQAEEQLNQCWDHRASRPGAGLLH